MKTELGELHAQHETDASNVLEWKETSQNLERQCLQQQAEIADLRSQLASLRSGDSSSKQPSQGHR